ncbi:hypothetical protein ACQ4PT_011651 [Festuca glaucescens]
MASKSKCSLLLLATVLISVLAAAAADSCFTGTAIPSSMLQRCRNYVEQQTCGVVVTDPGFFPGVVSEPYFFKERCCWELANISQNCRCEALRYFMGTTPIPDALSLKDLPGCPKEAQMNFVKILVTPGQCNLATIHNIRHCLTMDKSQY